MLERKSIKGFVDRHYITNGGIDTPSACGGVVHSRIKKSRLSFGKKRKK